MLRLRTSTSVSKNRRGQNTLRRQQLLPVSTPHRLSSRLLATDRAKALEDLKARYV